MQTKSVEQLPCRLTNVEKLQKAEQVAQLLGEVKALDEQKKSDAKRISLQIEDKHQELDALAEQVRSGFELRAVECIEQPRWSDGMVDTVRTDTGAVINSRAMHPAERQAALDLGEAPRGTKGKGKRGKVIGLDGVERETNQDGTLADGTPVEEQGDDGDTTTDPSAH